MATDREEYGAFDVLRFVLAAAVLLNHLGTLAWDQAGNLAVQVFFALSGWLIGGIVLRTPISGLGRFYYNRSARIWIPYFLAVTALYLTSFVFEPHRSPRWSQFLVYDLTFTHEWFSLKPNALAALAQMPLKGTGNHFWSLAVEEQFYLAAPLLIILAPFGRSVIAWAGIAALLYLANTPYGAVGFGVLAAVGAARHPGWHRHWPVRVALTLLLAGSALLMWVSAWSMWGTTAYWYWFLAPVFAVVLVLLLAVPVPRGPLARWLGGVSFPLYLNAWIGMFAANAVLKRLYLEGAWYRSSLEFVTALAGAAVIYQLVDVQVQRHRDRFYTPAVGWGACIAAYALVAGGVVFYLLVSSGR